MDWEAIRQEYIATDATYAALAKKYAVNANTIYKHAASEKWKEGREEFRRKMGEEALKSARTRGARAHAKALEVLMEASREQEERILEQLRRTDLKPGQIMQLSVALESATRTKRNLLGLPTQEEGHRQRIASEKLKLEKRKLDAGEKGVEGVDVEFYWPEGMKPEAAEGGTECGQS